ncbi:hypothetical protein T01_13770 [Trichinella spiralis]|uniref:Uncharacterized protein n=1 Tax=Trichinella spiralis TaxID=6334 RepID=A0A0V1B8M3_TRISP|nr:hypothetical protein T01_13770 [Trichinella spiralis]
MSFTLNDCVFAEILHKTLNDDVILVAMTIAEFEYDSIAAETGTRFQTDDLHTAELNYHEYDII